MSDYSAIYDPDPDFDAVYTRATARRITGRAPRRPRARGRLRHRADDRGARGAGARVVALDRSGDYLERLVARGLPDVEPPAATSTPIRSPTGPTTTS